MKTEDLITELIQTMPGSINIHQLMAPVGVVYNEDGEMQNIICKTYNIDNIYDDFISKIYDVMSEGGIKLIGIYESNSHLVRAAIVV